MKTIKLKIEGMHCSSCTALAKMTLEEVSGVKEAEVSLSSLSACVTAENDVSAEDLCKKIEEIGFSASEIK